jgi:hypothetical protein
MVRRGRRRVAKVGLWLKVWVGCCGVNGDCDTRTGACACDQGYFGVDCGETGELLVGPDNDTYYGGPQDLVEIPVQVASGGPTRTVVAGSVLPKDMAYFTAEVNGSIYDLTVVVRTLQGDADVYVLYDADQQSDISAATGALLQRGQEILFPTTLYNTWSSTKPKGTDTLDVVHICGSYDYFPRGQGQRRCTRPDPDFTNGGDRATLRIGVLGFDLSTETQFEISLEQDACVNIGCGPHGRCAVGVCVCDALWTGADCSVPDCPGEPECNGRGDCVLYPDARDPVCVCSLGFIGEGCEGLAEGLEVPVTIVPAGGTSAMPDSRPNGEIDRGIGIGNWTYFRVDMPSSYAAARGQTSLFVSVTQRTRADCVEAVRLAFNATTTSSAVLAQEEAGCARVGREGWGQGDIALFAHLDVLPNPTTFRFMDAHSWTVGSNRHTLLIDSTTGLVGGVWYIGVFNTAYARSRLHFSLNIDHRARCPMALVLSSCSGHGTCSSDGLAGQPVCECHAGYRGQMCQHFVTAIQAEELQRNGGKWVVQSEGDGEGDGEASEGMRVRVDPGSWTYFEIQVSPDLLGWEGADAETPSESTPLLVAKELVIEMSIVHAASLQTVSDWVCRSCRV